MGSARVGEVDNPRCDPVLSKIRVTEALLNVTVALGKSHRDEVVAAAAAAAIAAAALALAEVASGEELATAAVGAGLSDPTLAPFNAVATATAAAVAAVVADDMGMVVVCVAPAPTGVPDSAVAFVVVAESVDVSVDEVVAINTLLPVLAALLMLNTPLMVVCIDVVPSDGTEELMFKKLVESWRAGFDGRRDCGERERVEARGRWWPCVLSETASQGPWSCPDTALGVPADKVEALACSTAVASAAPPPPADAFTSSAFASNIFP